MPKREEYLLDLMPPAYEDGLDDWSRGDGTPDGPTYATAAHVRLARGDADFGICLEMRKVEPVQRLRYMGEVPVRAGRIIAISARVKLVRGPALKARIGAWPGGARGRHVPGLPECGQPLTLAETGEVGALRVVIGPRVSPGVDLVWPAWVLYAHVGVDLLGAWGGVVRIDRIVVRDVSEHFDVAARALPGFEAV